MRRRILPRTLRSWLMGVMGGTLLAAAAGTDARPKQPYRVLHWTTDHGLPQNRIFRLKQTRDGYLWLGTWFGLVCFDGVRCIVFDKFNTPELVADTVTALVETGDCRRTKITPRICGGRCARAGCFARSGSAGLRWTWGIAPAPWPRFAWRRLRWAICGWAPFGGCSSCASGRCLPTPRETAWPIGWERSKESVALRTERGTQPSRRELAGAECRSVWPTRAGSGL